MSEPDRQPSCPKCGYDEYRTRFVAPAFGMAKNVLSRAGCRTDGHLEYRCERCRYVWRGDCLDAKVEAENSGPIQPQKQGP